MSPKKQNNITPSTAIIWALMAVICIQGFFLVQKDDMQKPFVAVEKTAEGIKSKFPFFALPIKKEKKPAEVKKPAKVKPSVKKAPVKMPTGSKVGKIAIVLDDWGYNKSHCSYLDSIDVPLGVAIIPGLTYTKDVISCALKSGKEPMVHLPIEPHQEYIGRTEEYLLTTSMSPTKIKGMLKKILDEMPGVVGVNNHTGSKGTEDPALMTLIFAELKRRGLFFVDSLTTQRSVCEDVAGKLQMKIGRRNVFLDNRNSREYIEAQFAQAAATAKDKGYALLIGHDRKLTLLVIMEQVKKYEQKGYEFISPKEYVEQNGYPRN